jgi:molybdopterin synthase catalytic subunit
MTEEDYVGLSTDKLDTGALITRAQRDYAGAVCTFLGTTRDDFDGKRVTSLNYEAYEDMAIQGMQELVAKVRSQWDVCSVVIAHKLGSCPVGDTSVVIAVSSVHRKEALEAVDFAINELKRTVSIWKKELYDDGAESWKKNAEFASFHPTSAGGASADEKADAADGPEPCPNPLCKCKECTCGAGCTCGVSLEVVCDPCAAFKMEMLAKKAAAAAASASQTAPPLPITS